MKFAAAVTALALTSTAHAGVVSLEYSGTTDYAVALLSNLAVGDTYRLLVQYDTEALPHAGGAGYADLASGAFDVYRNGTRIFSCVVGTGCNGVANSYRVEYDNTYAAAGIILRHEWTTASGASLGVSRNARGVYDFTDVRLAGYWGNSDVVETIERGPIGYGHSAGFVFGGTAFDDRSVAAGPFGADIDFALGAMTLVAASNLPAVPEAPVPAMATLGLATVALLARRQQRNANAGPPQP